MKTNEIKNLLLQFGVTPMDSHENIVEKLANNIHRLTLMTYDYDKFKFYEHNRVPKSYATLKKSIKENDMTSSQRILVDEDYYIIDGQHRFLVCKELGLPIYYSIVPNNNTTDSIKKLNIAQRIWTMENHLYHNAKTIGGRWSEMLEFHKTYPLGISNIMIIYPNKMINASQMKNGKIQFEKSMKAEAIAEFLLHPDISRLNYSKLRSFVLAVIKAFDLYTTKELIRLRERMIGLKRQADYEQFLTAFEVLIKSRR